MWEMRILPKGYVLALCQRRMDAWQNTIDGTQAEYVRIRYADTSLYRAADFADEEALVMLSDILPTGFECGVLNGKIQREQLLQLWVQDRSDWQLC
jgi:threonine dehydrogenase-like Zn-dependent dehydrogenase